MKISHNWLQTYFDAPLPNAEVLSDALTFHVFEIDGIEKKGIDSILDVKVTANRGHDCLSYWGIAKEISAILNMPIKSDLLTGRSDLPDSGRSDLPVSVSIDSPLCNRFIAGLIRDVKVGPSPAWLVERLEAMGQRSINNVVDASNYVMFDLGQPSHAFDAGKITQTGNAWAIKVRTAKPGEKILALDEKEYMLNDSMLVIADAHADAAIGIAGVKGGTPASITDTTTDIIIECANFNSVSVRKTAQSLKLRSDASARFEQGISPDLAAYGMRAVVDLIEQLAGGEIVGFVDTYPNKQEIKPVAVSLSQINKTLGTAFTTEEVSDVFTRLNFSHTIDTRQEHKSDLCLMVTPPFERLDLIIPEDLIEEVGRIIGYDKVPSTPLPPSDQRPEVNPNFYAAEKVREELISQGYSEVFTSVFTEKGERVVANKVDGIRPHLRTNLTDGLTEALKKNIPNKELLGLKEIKLFEIGTVWKDGKETTTVGTITEKERATEHPLLSGEGRGEGALPPEYTNLPLSYATRYLPYSKYPYIVRDIAMWMPTGTDSEEVLKMIREQVGELLVRSTLFDQFQKGEKTSLAFRLIFQSFDRTLTDEEVNQIMQKISAALAAKGFEIR